MPDDDEPAEDDELIGGTIVPKPDGPEEPPGHPMTARDAYVFIKKEIG